MTVAASDRNQTKVPDSGQNFRVAPSHTQPSLELLKTHPDPTTFPPYCQCSSPHPASRAVADSRRGGQPPTCRVGRAKRVPPANYHSDNLHVTANQHTGTPTTATASSTRRTTRRNPTSHPRPYDQSPFVCRRISLLVTPADHFGSASAVPSSSNAKLAQHRNCRFADFGRNRVTWASPCRSLKLPG